MGKKQCSKEMRILVQRTPGAPPLEWVAVRWFPLQLFAFLSCQRHSKDGFQGSFDSMTKEASQLPISRVHSPSLFPDSPSGKPNPQDPHRPPRRSAPAPACSSPPRSLAGPPPHPNKFGRQFWSASSKVWLKLRGKQACAQA